MVKLFSALVVACSIASCSLASECNDSTRAKRYAWHTLSSAERKDYLKAEVCLMNKAPTTGLKGATNRFEDFQTTHQIQTYLVHKVGAFLPWHRAFVAAHEQALRNECGYQGHQPYWAEELDSGNFKGSVILDPVDGFGGNGTAEDLCITDGPFAGFVNHIGPGYAYTDHCIRRQLNDTDSLKTLRETFEVCLAKGDFLSMWPCLESLPHQGGHGGIGGTLGTMRDPISSPGDPLFYMHHSWMDKLWADWQKKDLSKRLTEMGGNNILNSTAWPNLKRPEGVPEPTGASGDPGLETTLGHVLNMYGNGANRTIGEVMDIWNGQLCYEYVQY